MAEEKYASIVVNPQRERVIKITFPYDLDELTRIRSLPGRTYHAEQRCWSAPIRPDIINKLRTWNYRFDEQLNKYVDRIQQRSAEIENIAIPGLRGTLFPFQAQGVTFIEFHNGRAIIGDEMGLGKTIQALAWLQLHPEKRPVIIVAPAIAKLHWERKAHEWMETPDVEILSGTRPWLPKSKIVIINYDILPAWVTMLRIYDAQVLIADEAHYFKNNRSKRTKAIKQLARFIPHFIPLSGTLAKSRPIELYNPWQLVDPVSCPKYPYFIQRYCNAHFNGFAMDISGSSHLDELHERLGTVMIRRLKKDVLKELPPKIYSYVPIDINNTEDYTHAEQDFISFVRKFKGDTAALRASRAEAFAKTETLKQLAVRGKINNAIDWIKEFLESEQKLVVFATHTATIDSLMSEFSDVAVKIDGSTLPILRQQAEDRFQTDPAVRLFVGNMQAAGVAITLTAASNVAILELPWTPGDLDQATDRCHRITQRDSVTVHVLLANNTIEERIAQLLDQKRIVLNKILNGELTEDSDLLFTLMQEYE